MATVLSAVYHPPFLYPSIPLSLHPSIPPSLYPFIAPANQPSTSQLIVAVFGLPWSGRCSRRRRRPILARVSTSPSRTIPLPYWGEVKERQAATEVGASSGAPPHVSPVQPKVVASSGAPTTRWGRRCCWPAARSIRAAGDASML